MGQRDHHTGFGNQVWKIDADKKSQKANPCLWMQADAVKLKSCNNFYSCNTCKYDFGMQKKVALGKQVSWQDNMRKKESMDRVCRHSLTQRIERRVCPFNYNCSSCEFDQYFEDVLTPKTTSTALNMRKIKGFDMPQGYYFHNGHTWARIENGGFIRVGLDDFSLKLLGKADALDLPLTGKVLNEDKVGWGLKRKDNTADVLSPINGVITEVNPKVRKNPELANQDPYGDGWLFNVHTSDIKGTFKQLMDDSDSIGWINDEVDLLENMIEDVAGPLSADGGFLQEDIIGNLPALGWNNLTKAFLKT
jgi:glycine cleavage system H lipoate-binding protein/uncharacterized CHY-type Zn-finger protein